MQYEVTLVMKSILRADDVDGAATEAQRQFGVKGGYTYQVKDIESGAHFDVVTEQDPEPEPTPEPTPEPQPSRQTWWKRPS